MGWVGHGWGGLARRDRGLPGPDRCQKLCFMQQQLTVCQASNTDDRSVLRVTYSTGVAHFTDEETEPQRKEEKKAGFLR